MSKKIKAFELDALRGALKDARDYVIVEPIRVDAGTEYEFRKRLRAKKIRCQLVKNSYGKKIFAENGLSAGEVWSGPTLLCWGGANIKELSTTVDGTIKDLKKDPKAPDKFKVKTAIADGAIVSLEDAKKMPTREEAIGGIVAALLAPGANLAAALIGPGGTLGLVLKAIEEKAEKAAEPAAADAPAETAAPETAS